MGFVERNSRRWPNGIIPLNKKDVFRPISSGGTLAGNQALRLAEKEYEDKTAIEFIDATIEDSYVELYSSDIFCGGRGCSVVYPFGGGPGNLGFLGLSAGDPLFLLLWLISFIPSAAYGRVGGRQDLTTVGFNNRNSATQWQVYNIIHEMGHAIGLLHEHQRPDRDAAVTVTVEEVVAINFNIINGFTVGGYDCNSVMNYLGGVDAGAICTAPLGPRYQTTNIPGISIDVPILSNGDVKSVNFLYPIKRLTEHHWDTDWVPSPYFNFKNRSMMAWYQPKDGHLAISEFQGDSEREVLKTRLKIDVGRKKDSEQIQLFKAIYGYMENLQPLVTSNGDIIIFFYERWTGKVLLIEINGTGTPGSDVTASIKRSYNTTQFNHWTHFSNFRKNNQQYIMAYSKSSGDVRIYRIKDDGSSLFMTKWRPSSKWDKDWTHFNFIEKVMNGKNEVFLLSHKEKSGRTSLAKLRDFSSIDPDVLPSPLFDYLSPSSSNTSQDSIGKQIGGGTIFRSQTGWSIYTTYHNFGEHYLLCYSERSSRLQIWNISNIVSWELIGETRLEKWSKSGTIQPYYLPKLVLPYPSKDSSGQIKQWFVSYNPDGGNALFGRIHSI